MKLSSALLLAFLLAASGPARASAHPASAEMSVAAQAFLAALTPDQQRKALFELKDNERQNWHYIPKERKGLPLKELQPAQLDLAHAFISSGLSQKGYIKAATIMSLEQVLYELEQQRGPTRDPLLYYLSIFGKPAPDGTWAWRVEGHHLSLNFTIIEGRTVSATPSFFGSNPGEIKEGPRKGLRVLGNEEDLGRQLVKSLDASQKALGIYTNVAPREILTTNAHQVTPLKIDGLPAAKMTAAQKAILRNLIEEYAYRTRPDVAGEDMKKIQDAGFDKVHFAWAGGLERGEGHYYCVQGPTFMMEYDNTQNNNNHIHTVWRDFQNDFGEDLLRKHYRDVPH